MASLGTINARRQIKEITKIYLITVSHICLNVDCLDIKLTKMPYLTAPVNSHTFSHDSKSYLRIFEGKYFVCLQ